MVTYHIKLDWLYQFDLKYSQIYHFNVTKSSPSVWFDSTILCRFPSILEEMHFLVLDTRGSILAFVEVLAWVTYNWRQGATIGVLPKTFFALLLEDSLWNIYGNGSNSNKPPLIRSLTVFYSIPSADVHLNWWKPICWVSADVAVANVLWLVMIRIVFVVAHRLLTSPLTRMTINVPDFLFALMPS